MKRANEKCNLIGVHLSELHMKFGGDDFQASAHALYGLVNENGSATLKGEMVGPWPTEIITNIIKLRDEIEQCLLQLHFGTEEDNESDPTRESQEPRSILSARLGQTPPEIDQI